MKFSTGWNSWTFSEIASGLFANSVVEMRREHREQLLARALLHVERPPMADQRRGMDEAVLGRLVGDAIGVGAMRAHAQTAERKDAGAERAGVELVEQRIERDLILDVGGILDDQVRQGESRCGLTYTRRRSDTVIDGRNDCQFNELAPISFRRDTKCRNVRHALAALRGSIPPLITPFTRGAVDYDRYAELVEFQIEQGSHGILVNGTTAEPSTLTTDERNRLVTLAVETTKGRVPVVAATGSQSLAESRVLTEHALTAGADALLIVTPYYIRPPQRGLVAYYLELAAGHDVPWMIYHIPGRTAVGVTLDTLKAVQGRARRISSASSRPSTTSGSSPNACTSSAAISKSSSGLEELSFPMMTIGACGLMNAVGNLKPKVLAQMCEAVFAADLATGKRLHDQLLEINKAVFFDTNPIPMKYMMKKLGLLADNEHRLPMVSATPELAAKLDGVLERAGL